MATIRERKSSKTGKSTYQAIVEIRGFPVQRATFARKTDARGWALRIEASIREGRYLPTTEARKHTLADLVERFIAKIELEQHGSAVKYAAQLRWWNEQIGAYALSQVTPALIAETRDHLSQGAARMARGAPQEGEKRRTGATVNRYLAALSVAFEVAVKEWHWLESNPVKRISKRRESAGRVRYLSIEERDRLLSACKQSEVPELLLIVMLALTTGMRRGEILGLRWPDIDLRRNTIVLHHTKNGERRAVPIVSAVRPLLEEHGRRRYLHSDLLFPQLDTDKPKDLDKLFPRAVARAGIEDFHFHDLRHTTASYLAMSGATTAEIATVLGHKTLAMVKRYSHLGEQHVGAVVERMTSKFGF